jgi:hypothetical protein
LASLAGGYLLYRRSQDISRKLMATRLDPYGEDEYPRGLQSRPDLAPGQKLVVFFGDSRAWEWPAPRGLRRFAFANRGLSGQTAVQCLGRFDKHVRPLKPEVLVVQVGVNDLGAIPSFPGQEGVIIGHCKMSLAEMVTRARSEGGAIILTTIFPPGGRPFERLRSVDGVTKAIAEVEVLSLAVSPESVTLVDTAAILAGEDGFVARVQPRLDAPERRGILGVEQQWRLLEKSLHNEKSSTDAKDLVT